MPGAIAARSLSCSGAIGGLCVTVNSNDADAKVAGEKVILVGRNGRETVIQPARVMTLWQMSPRYALSLVMFVIATGLPVLGQDPVETAVVGATKFAKQSGTMQKRLHKQLVETADAVGGDYFDAMRRIAAAGAARMRSATKSAKTNRPKKRAPKSDGPTWELPAARFYVYGRRTIESRRGSASKLRAAARKADIELALLGMMPNADVALSELERELDQDRGGDEFAAFLESWRNGDESFYEALDRTAGTKDSVFFYDVMLGDFVAAFAKGKDQASRNVRKGLNASHDALHDAFLSYRQYRAFREAVALSLVLPPDVPLPKRLSRYEDRLGGIYSLRDQVTMVLALNEYDPMAVAKLVSDGAKPLSVPLWAERHDPYPAWRKLFEAAMPDMLEKASSSDDYLKQAVEKRNSDARKVRLLASTVGVAPA
jgi:hypothetical protein